MTETANTSVVRNDEAVTIVGSGTLDRGDLDESVRDRNPTRWVRRATVRMDGLNGVAVCVWH